MKLQIALISLFCLVIFPLLGELSLNDFGKINRQLEEIKSVYEENEHIIIAGSLRPTSSLRSFLQEVFFAVLFKMDVPTALLRFYDEREKEHRNNNYRKIKNITTSSNGSCAAFAAVEKTDTVGVENSEVSEQSLFYILDTDSPKEQLHKIDFTIKYQKKSETSTTDFMLINTLISTAGNQVLLAKKGYLNKQIKI
jgi:hypothetical protein